MKGKERSFRRLMIVTAIGFVLLITNYLYSNNLQSVKAFGYEDIEVCAGQSVSNGYLVTDIYFDVGRCDGMKIDEIYSEREKEPPGNVWLYESYKDMEVDDEKDVCATQSLPDGWVKVDSYFDVGKCNGLYLDDIYSPTNKEPSSNVWTIRKIR